MDITEGLNENRSTRMLKKRPSAMQAGPLKADSESDLASPTASPYEIVTLEMESCLPPADRPDTVRGLLVAETDHYYHIVDALGAIWMLPKRKWKIVKMEVIKE